MAALCRVRSIYSTNFQLNNLQKCNWLEHDHGLRGRVIDFPNTLDDKLTANNKYNVYIRLDNKKETDFSLWITYTRVWVIE